MPSLGPVELIIILVIVLLLFGVGRLSRIGGELGSAVSNFRKGVDEGRKKDEILPPDPVISADNVKPVSREELPR